MCGALVGCIVCEGYAFSSKNARLLNCTFHELSLLFLHFINTTDYYLD